MFRHYLQPLLAPATVALVGATEREGALGAIVYRNLEAGGPRGGLYLVNPKHRTIFGRRAYRRLQDLPQRPDLAVIVTPARSNGFSGLRRRPACASSDRTAWA
jgi:acetyltransferase